MAGGWCCRRMQMTGAVYTANIGDDTVPVISG
jgi:hypothetical protein